MQIVLNELTVEEIDEALDFLRQSLQDYYGHRLTFQQREFYLASVDDLLDARNAIVGGQRIGNQTNTNSNSEA
jgi:hypothetical protein